MEKTQEVKKNKNRRTILAVLLLLTALGCETPKQGRDLASLNTESYTKLDLTKLKDKEFFDVLEKGLQNSGSLQSVFVKNEELLLYREGKRPYPTNYRYLLRASPGVSLEKIKQPNSAAH
jgi:hypothetical protein